LHWLHFRNAAPVLVVRSKSHVMNEQEKYDACEYHVHQEPYFKSGVPRLMQRGPEPAIIVACEPTGAPGGGSRPTSLDVTKTAEDNPILWQPSEARQRNSAMYRFMVEHGANDWSRLYQWSIDQPQAFWAAV